MSEQQPPKPEFDPFAAWKPLQDAWAKAMSETVASEEFAKSMGDYMDAYLQTSAPVRQLMEKAVERYLQQMGLPTRGEVISQAERLSNLEMRVDDLDAKMDEALDHLKAIRAALADTKAHPARRKKAKSKDAG